MTESTIKISKEYKDFSGSLWLGREVTISEGIDDPISAFRKAEQEMDSYFRSRSATPSLSDYNTGERSIESSASHEEKRIQGFIDDIQACNAIDERNQLGVQVGLISFENLRHNPLINAAYNKRLEELSK